MPRCACIESLEQRVLLSGGLAPAFIEADPSQANFARQNYRFAIEFDATPTESYSNVAIGLSLGPAAYRGDLGVLVRFAPNGHIQARNGNVISADSDLAYAAGRTYRFTIIADVTNHTFSAYVQELGTATQVVLAHGYSFLAEQADVAGLNRWAVMAKRGDAEVRSVNLSASANVARVALPAAGKIYHGVFPGGVSTWEDDITAAQTNEYEMAAGAKTAWVYFSDNWFDGQSRAFPTETATWIRDRRSTPYIRLTTTSQPVRPASGPDPVFSLDRIIAGDFDEELRQWGRGARAFGTPVLAEWGTEVNGDWFNWNGRWHGAGETTGFGDPALPDGPERFVAAYKHIVRIVRSVGARNVNWVWHVNWSDGPEEEWNRFENYYPGPEVVDWIGISAYGPQRPTQNYAGWSFREQMDEAYARLQSIAPEKPVIVAEFGAAVNNAVVSAEEYAGAALEDILAKRWPTVVGFSWWNERWQNDSDPAWNLNIDTDMRVQDSAQLTSLFTSVLDRYDSILQTHKRTGPYV